MAAARAALAVWSLAPLLAVAGVWTRSMSLVTLALALVLEATSVISFGAGPIYIPIVLLPLTITWALARASLRSAKTA